MKEMNNLEFMSKFKTMIRNDIALCDKFIETSKYLKSLVK